MPLRAVTFDFWNTIVFEERGHLRGRRAEAWAGILEEAGFTAEREALGAIFDSTWEVLNSRWESMEPLHPQHAAEMAVDALGQNVPFDIRTKLIEAFGDAAIGAELRLTEGIREALETLKRAGMKLGIVCDIGFTASPYLRDFLKHQELLDLFEGWAFSDEVGVYKPSPRIFEHVLAPLGVAGADAAHVGDRKRTDVAGAFGMGMLPVRYTGVYDDPDELPGRPARRRPSREARGDIEPGMTEGPPPGGPSVVLVAIGGLGAASPLRPSGGPIPDARPDPVSL